MTDLISGEKTLVEREKTFGQMVFDRPYLQRIEFGGDSFLWREKTIEVMVFNISSIERKEFSGESFLWREKTLWSDGRRQIFSPKNRIRWREFSVERKGQ